MPAKSQIPWLLAAVVLAACTHCVYAHAIEAADWYHESRMEEQRLDDERTTCENESACICKGATFLVVVEAPAPELGFVHLVCVASPGERLAVEAAAGQWQILPDYGKPPASGSLLRARLQRYLL